MGGLTLKTPGGLVTFQDDDDVIRPAVAQHGVWEPEETALIVDRLHTRPGVFVDLGAHVGYHTVQVLAAAVPGCDVLSVEPNPAAFRLLAGNVSRAQKRATLLECAAWDDDVDLALVRGEARNGGDFRSLGMHDAYRVEPLEDALIVRAMPMDKVLLHGSRVAVVKSDLQGRDHIALRGMFGTLVQHRPDVLVEFDPALIGDAPARPWARSPQEIIRWYQELHYGVHVLAGSGRVGPVGDPDEITNLASRTSGGVTLWLQPIERFRR